MNSAITQLSFAFIMLLLTLPASAQTGLNGANAKATAGAPQLMAYSNYIGSSSGALVPSDSELYMYPSSTTMNKSQSFSWKYNMGQWDSTLKTDFPAYDQFGNYSLRKSQYWNSVSSTYDFDERDSGIYNAAGYLIEEIIEKWDAATKSWFKSKHWLYTRNANNDVIVSTYETGRGPANNIWVSNHRYINSGLNTRQRPTKQQLDYWDLLTNTWQPNTQLLYTYDTSDTGVIQVFVFNRDNRSGAWDTISKSDYILNAAGMPVQETYRTYDSLHKMYILGTRWTYTYNASGSVTDVLHEDWYGGVTGFVNYADARSTYNSYNQRTSFEIRY